MPKERRSRCPKGTVRNKKTGICEQNTKAKSPNKTQKVADILEERRECINNWRIKTRISKKTQKKRK